MGAVGVPWPLVALLSDLSAVEPMDSAQLSWITNSIWGIADAVLRDLYARGKYRDVILPMTERSVEDLRQRRAWLLEGPRRAPAAPGRHRPGARLQAGRDQEAQRNRRAQRICATGAPQGA